MAVGSQLIGIATGVVTRKVSMVVLDKVWRRTKKTEPPADPASPGTPWTEALLWAAASGVAVGVSRLVTTKGAATAKMKLTGKAPEGMEGPGPRGGAVGGALKGAAEGARSGARSRRKR
jgi:hypothetical protein